MEVAVISQSGQVVDTVNLNDAVFNVPMNHALVHQALVGYQLNKRHGTHDTKTRAQVSGGGRKPWIQKHTGRARQGSIRSPQWRHGGVVFGPHPRSYRKALPKRMRRTALRCVLSEKAREGLLVCLDSFDTVNGKTRSMVDLLNNLGINGSALLVTQGSQDGVVRAAHNIQKIWTLPVNLLNAQELLSRETLVITLDAVRWAEESLASDPHGRRGSSAVGSAQQPVLEVEQEVEQEAAGPEASSPEPAQEQPESDPASEAGSDEAGEEEQS
ncbi:MAG: 50S ribosomal protein L4 [SAR202 cluster bacterium Io17-Chloro-G2]|nr:MAG: 50S ribosomal protein L4 [SAR202 cluster bacterium Io17-Chloro-G2]